MATLTAAEKWERIEKAWATYCHEGAGVFDWDFDSRDLMREMTEHGAFGNCAHGPEEG